jgi:hypothetical protein
MHPKKGHSYAVGAGTYVGEIFIFINEKQEEYEFISIPKNINRYIPKDKFDVGLEYKILDYVGPIEPNVFELLQKQFEFNKDSDK